MILEEAFSLEGALEAKIRAGLESFNFRVALGIGFRAVLGIDFRVDFIGLVA